MIKKLQFLHYYRLDMKNYASLLFHFTSFGGFIRQLIEEEWKTINLIKYNNFSTSLSTSSPWYLERSRQHFHSSDVLTDPVFLLPAGLSADVFSTPSPQDILGPEIGRAGSSQFLFCSLPPLSPLLPSFVAEEEDTQLCWARCPVLATQNLHRVVLL